MTDGEGHTLMRSAYNWLRHDDGKAEEQRELSTDIHMEAATVVERAIENLLALTGRPDHPRHTPLLHRFRYHE